jgi:hypothetical protein
MRPKRDTSDPFALATAVASRHGVFSLAQLVDAGGAGRWAARQVAAGHLHRLHRGVYSIVPPRLLKVEGRWLGAVLACGEGAVLSHACAAALWDLRAIPSGPIHVTVPTTAGRRRRQRIALHRSRTLLPGHAAVRRDIPVTSPARTLSDLRRTLPPDRFRAVLRRAERQLLDIGPQPEHVSDPDRSELERRMLALCRRHSLPLPLAQQPIGPYTVDFPSGPIIAWSSRPTAGMPTAPARPSSPTGPGTRGSPAGDIGWCGSPGGG